MKDARTGTNMGLKWSNRRPNAPWQGAIDHCNALNYGGVTGWRLPTKDELVVAYNNGITGAAKVGWMTASEMDTYFWSSSSHAVVTDNGYFVYQGTPYGNSNKASSYAVVCVQ
jgi:hypothetical protein